MAGDFDSDPMSGQSGETPPDNQHHQQPQGYVPEVQAHLTKQHEIHSREKAALENRVAELERRATTLQGYEEVFTRMSSDPRYSPYLQAWIDGVDPSEVNGASPVQQNQQSPPPVPTPGTPPRTQSAADPSEFRRIAQEEVRKLEQGLKPAYEMLMNLHTEREVAELIRDFPEAKNHVPGIQKRVQDSRGTLSLKDAFRLEYWDEMQKRQRQVGVQEGMRSAQFRTEPPGFTDAAPERTAEISPVDKALKSGDRALAARLSLREELSKLSR